MFRFVRVRSQYKFASVRALVHNPLNAQRSLYLRVKFKKSRAALSPNGAVAALGNASFTARLETGWIRMAAPKNVFLVHGAAADGYFAADHTSFWGSKIG